MLAFSIVVLFSSVSARGDSHDSLQAAIRVGDYASTAALLQQYAFASPAYFRENSKVLLGSLFAGWHAALNTVPPDVSVDLDGYSRIFPLLVDAGVNTSQACPLGHLVHAVRNRNIVGMRALLSSYDSEGLPRCIATADVTGSVLMHYAAKSAAPGLARILTGLRGLPSDVTDPLANALGFAHGFPAWTSRGEILKGDIEAAAGIPELDTLRPFLLTLTPGQRAVALTARNHVGETPLSIACSQGRVVLIPWLLSAGTDLFAAGDVEHCTHLLTVGGFVLDSGSSAAWAAIRAALGNSTGRTSATVVPVIGEEELSQSLSSSVPHSLPPSFNADEHAAAGWGVMSPESLSRLGFPSNLFEGGAASAFSTAGGVPCDELPLIALSSQYREARRARRRPFIVRANQNASRLSPAFIIQLVGNETTAVSVGNIPYAREYGRGGSTMALGGFIRDFMGVRAGESVSPHPYVFDSNVLNADAAKRMASMFARRRASLFPGPPGLSQFIVGPPSSGSALHFHPAAANFLLVGLKAWVLGPPVAAGFADVSAPLWGGGGGRTAFANASADYVQCLQGPGDLMFVPDQWGHAVINLADSVAVAYESLV